VFLSSNGIIPEISTAASDVYETTRRITEEHIHPTLKISEEYCLLEYNAV
jgi:hypothetical protein